MPLFEVKVRVTNVEVWTVDAENEVEAKEKIEKLDSAVDCNDSRGGEIIDWEIMGEFHKIDD